MEDIKKMIRNIPDFPKKGIIFRDITTAVKDPETMKKIIDYIADEFKNEKIDYVAGIESRGFIFGMPIAFIYSKAGNKRNEKKVQIVATIPYRRSV